ncbi:MAG: ImmA/IrrE family metallo-endopeptidase, partial [Oscillospiraceae bacterium]
IMANVRSLPVSPAELAEFFGVKVVTYADCARVFDKSLEELYRESTMGFSFPYEGSFVCALNENACGFGRGANTRQRWTLAHELGHCMLGHLSGEKPDIQQEREADKFAAQLLAPLTVLHFCAVRSAGEIERLCGISAQAAGYRFEELTRLRRSSAERFRSWRVTDRQQEAPESAFLADSDDMRLLVQFSPFVGQYIYDVCRDEAYK